MIKFNLLLAFFSLSNFSAIGSESPKAKPNKADTSNAEVKDFFCDGTKAFSGYYIVENGSTTTKYFYVLVRAKHNEAKKLTVWLNGGPGCSSMLGLFTENGPCLIDGKHQQKNLYSWNKYVNVMYVDQPDGVGFSYNIKGPEGVNSMDGVAENFYQFLQHFFEANEEFKNMDFYIASESFGGRYAPAIARRIHDKNQNEVQGNKINLKGVSIGNAFIDPFHQYAGFSDMGFRNRYNIKAISRFTYARMRTELPKCQKLIETCYSEYKDEDVCINALNNCEPLFDNPFMSSGLGIYDLRRQCTGADCLNMDDLNKYLNYTHARDKLNVDANAPPFVACNNTVEEHFVLELLKSSAEDVKLLVNNGLKLLLYCGDADYIVNCNGIEIFLNDFHWVDEKKFSSAKFVPWMVDGKTVGSRKTYGPLTFLIIYDAGHTVPTSQPKNALSMFETFIGLQKWNA